MRKRENEPFPVEVVLCNGFVHEIHRADGHSALEARDEYEADGCASGRSDVWEVMDMVSDRAEEAKRNHERVR